MTSSDTAPATRSRGAIVRRVWPWALAAALVAGATLWWAGRGRIPSPSTIVLVTIDTLRADHLGCYGYPRPTSPFLDGLAREGILFTHAFAPISTTSPSHASLFTSLYPLQHGVRKNGQVLADSFVTLAEALRGQGFVTAAFVSTDVHFGPGNMAQGFDHFDEISLPRFQYRRAGETVDSAIDWLAGQDHTGKLFVWVHLFDPHPPYHRADVLQPGGEDAESLARFFVDEHHIDLDFFHDKPASLLWLMDNYDGEIRVADRALERLFRRLRQVRPADEILWIVTADHGEGLGNHRWLSHGKYIYNEQLHVPLIFHFSPRRAPVKRVDELVETVDLFPTIAELLSFDIQSRVPDMSGRSFLPLLSGGHTPPKRYVYAERRLFDPRHRPKPFDPEKAGYEDGEAYALQDGEFKYLYRTAGDDEFFRIADDPYEVNDLIGTGLPAEQEMRQRLLGEIAALGRDRRNRVAGKVDADTIERLRALGYEP